MSPIRSRIALAGAATVLAAGAASGGALLGGDAATAATPSAKPCKTANKGKAKRPKAKALNGVVRAAVKDARTASKGRLSPEQLRDAVAPAVKKAVDDGTVPQKLVDRRAARMQALADAFKG